MANDFRAIIQIAYDMAKGNKQLQADIKKIQEQYKIKFKAELDDKSALNSIKQMEKYQDSFNKKNLNGIDLEIKKRQEQSQIFSNQIKSQMQERVSAENKIQNELKQTAKEQQNAFKLDEGKLQVFNRIGTYMSNNTKLTKEQVSSLKELQTSISSVNDKSGLDQIKTKFSSIKSEANALGTTGDTIFARLKKNSAQFLNYLGSATLIMGSIRAFQNIVDEVKNIDSAMISLKKVTNETDTTYESFLVNTAQKAKELGASISDLVNATADFARLGYNLPDAAKLGEVATLYKNVGDGINIEGATQSIISTMKAFNIQAENSMSIIDKFNQVGNNFAISSTGIGDSLMRSASALMEANNTLDESIALTVAANNVVQDPEKVGNMWKTVAMRIRGAKTELEEAGLETEGMVESTSKLRDEIKSLTGGFDIMIDNNTFKSTYDIVLGISKVYDKMSDTSQANILEMLAGKRQGNALAAALNNAEDLQKALESSQQSFGSALEEQQKYEEGIQYSLDRLKASTQELSMTTLDSSIIKFIVDLANGAVNATTAVGGLVPVLSTLAVLYLSFNKNEKFAFMQSFISYLFKTKLTADATAISVGGLTLSVKALTGIITGGLLIAIPLIVKGLDVINTTLEEQKEALESANTAYEESKTKLESINSELKTTAERIDELEAKDNLTFVEDGELEKLKDITAELLIQRDAWESIELGKAKELAEAAIDTFNKQFGAMPISQNQVDSYNRDIDYTDESNLILLEEENNISNMIAAYNQLEKAKKDALLSGNTVLADSYNKMLEDVSLSLKTNVTELGNLQSKLKEVPYDELTNDQKQYLTEINNAIELIYANIDPSKLKEINFTEVFNSLEMKNVKEELEAIAKAGQLTPEVLTSNKEYQKLLDKTKLTAKEVSEQINALTTTTEEQGDKSEESITSLSDSLKKLSTNGKLLSSIKKEFEELGTLSTDSLQDIIDKYPELEDAIIDYQSHLINEEELIQKLDSAYQTDFENYATAILEKKKLDSGFYDGLIERLPSWVTEQADAYGIDLENYENYHIAKQELDKKYATASLLLQAANEFKPSNPSLAMSGKNIKNYLQQELVDIEEIIDEMINYSAIGYTPSTIDKPDKTNTSNTTDPIKDAFDLGINGITGKNDLDHQLAMEKINQEQYLDGLEKINKATFGKNKKTHLEQYRQYVEEVSKGRKKIDEDNIKSKFDDLSHSFAMGDIKTEEEYQTARWELAKEYYKNNKDYLNEWKKAQEEWHKWNIEQTEKELKETEKKRLDTIDKIISKYGELRDAINKTAEYQSGDEQVNIYLEGIKSANKEIKYIENEIKKLNKKKITSLFTQDDYDSQLKTLQSALSKARSSIEDFNKSIADSIKSSSKDVMDTLEDNFKKMTEYWENEKNAYSDIIKAQKDILNLKKEQNEYEKSIAKKTKEISKIESRMAELQKAASTGDRQANAELQKLNEELADKKEDLSDTQADHEHDLANKALDKALDDNNKIVDAKLKAIKTEYETQRDNQQKLYDQLIELTSRASNYSVEAYSKAIDEIASKMAQNGIGLNVDHITSLKNAQAQSYNNTNSVYSILGNKSNANMSQDTSSLSGLNKYLASQGYSIANKDKMVQLAQALGLYDINNPNMVGTDEFGRLNKNRIMEALKRMFSGSTFAKGGIASLPKMLGEDGIAFVKNGEPILTVEQGKLFKELVNNIKPLNNLVKLTTPNVSNITNNSSPTVVVNLPPSTVIDNDAINNYRKLIPELTSAISDEILGIGRQFK